MSALWRLWYRVVRSCRALASKASGEARVSVAIPSGLSPITVNLYVSISDVAPDDLTPFAAQMAREINDALLKYPASSGLVS